MPAESPALSVWCFPRSPDGGIGNILINSDGTNVKGTAAGTQLRIQCDPDKLKIPSLRML